MRVYVFGGLGLALATSIYTAPDALAFGDYDDEVSLSEFFQDRASYTTSDLREERSNLLEALREARKPADRSERDDLKDQLDLLKIEKDFAETMDRSVRPKLGSRTEWKKIAEADAEGIQKAIEEALAEKNSAAPGTEVTLRSRQIGGGHEVNGYPFRVINTVDFEEKGGRYRAIVSQKVVLDESIPRSEWSSSFRRKFEDMSEADMQKFLDDNVNEALEETGYEVAKLEDFEDAETKAKIMDNLPTRLASEVVSDSFGSSQSSAFREGVADRLEELGSSSDLSSDIGSLTEEYNLLSDSKIRRERLDGLEAKYKVASALSSNASLRKKFEEGDIEACEEIIKIVGGEDNFRKLSDSAKMGCDSFLEKEEVAEAEEETAAEIQEEIVENDRRQTASAQSRFADLVQHCKARRQALANGQIAGPFDALIGPMYRGLLANGAGCTYFGTFMGKVDSVGASDDMMFAGIFGADLNQMMGMESTFNTAYSTKAKEHVSEMAIPSYEGTKKLEEQAQCLSKMASLGNMSLQSVAGTVPGGLMNPQLAQDPKIQQMKKFSDAAGALHKAVVEELTVRKTGGVGGLTAMQSRNGGRSPAGVAGTQKSLSSIGGTAVPVRQLNTADSWAERDFSGTTLNQGMPSIGGNSGGLTPLPANAPPPMFDDN